MPSLDKVITFRPDDDTYEAMESLRLKVGVPFAEQIRRALRVWLEQQNLLKPEARKHTRKRT